MPFGDDPRRRAMILGRTAARRGRARSTQAAASASASRSAFATSSRARRRPSPRTATRASSSCSATCVVVPARRPAPAAEARSSRAQLIIREGDVGDAAYMIVSGRCRAYRAVGRRPGDAGHHGRGRRLRRDGAAPRRAARGDASRRSTTVTVLVLDKSTMTEGLGYRRVDRGARPRARAALPRPGAPGPELGDAARVIPCADLGGPPLATSGADRAESTVSAIAVADALGVHPLGR